MSKKTKDKKYKRLARRKWTFDGKRDQEAVWVRGLTGGSNWKIKSLTGLTDGQIHYGLRLLKDTLKLKKSLRQLWRDGEAPFQNDMLSDYHAIMIEELRTVVVPVLVHPTPETVKVPE